MKLADAHLHLFRRGFPGIYGKSLLGPEVEVYESLRSMHAIGAGLVVGYEGEGIDPGNNAYIRGLAADRPWMATVAYVDAHSAPTASALSVLLDAGHAGVALYLTDATATDAAVAWPSSTWRVLDDARAIVSLNIAPNSMTHLVPIIQDCAGCTFLISHLGLPGRYKNPPSAAEAAARLSPLIRLAALPNVMVKISAPYAVSDPSFAYPHHAAKPLMDVILGHFGPQRCLWGSDFSPALDHVSFAQTVSNPWLERLDDGSRELVMGRNLTRILESRKKLP